jgi:Na+-translocating ferredoxin:NAD+ oxidoreductase RNF subunit RnfB
MIITGDDILIEYVSRIISLMSSILSQYHSKFKEEGKAVDMVDQIIPQSIRQTLE